MGRPDGRVLPPASEPEGSLPETERGDLCEAGRSPVAGCPLFASSGRADGVLHVDNAMLDTMRRGANTFVAKLLLGLLTLSFIGWGVGSRLGSLHSDTIATVGGTKISLGEFQMAYQRQSQAFARQLGQPLTTDMARAFGLPQQVIGGLLGNATVEEMSADLGLGISDARLARMITDDPTLRPPGANAFDHTFFLRLLQENGLSEAMYLRQRKVQALETQISDGLTGGAAAPKALVAAVYRYRNESRTVEYLTLARAQVDAPGTPADDVLAKWFETNKANFKAPEFRSLEYIGVQPADLADPASVSDADVRKEYDRIKSQYTQPEQRRIEQIMYPTAEAADAAAAKLKAGTTFDQLVAEQGQTVADADLGLLTRAKVADPAVADAAFSAAANVPTAPVKTNFGTVILRVTEIQPEHGKSFEEVAPDIRKTIAEKLAERSVVETHDEIEDALAGGATLKEVATRFKLKLQTLETDKDGNDASGQPITGIPDQDKFLKAAFNADEGSQNDALQNGRGYIWFDVAKVVPGRDRTLDEVKDKAIAAWADEEAQARLKAKAEAMVVALKAGQSIADLAKKASVEVETAEVTRQTSDAGLGTAGLKAAFAGPVGQTEAVSGPDGTRVVLTVTKVDNPPMPEGAGDSVDIADQMSVAMSRGLLDQFVAAAEERYGTTINQTMLNSVVGSSSN